MQSGTRYILINSDKSKETPLDWTGRVRFHSASSKNLSYKEKKRLVSDLHPKLETLTRVNTGVRGLLQTASKTSKISNFIYSSNQRNQETFRMRTARPSIQGISSIEKDLPEVIREEGHKARKNKGRVVCVITARRFGLRFNFAHHICSVTELTQYNNFVHQCKKALFSSIKNQSKQVYFFHLGKEPINHLYELKSNELVILADLSPKINLPLQVQIKVFQYASFLEQQVLSVLNEFNFYQSQSCPSRSSHHNDWEKIRDVKRHVDALIQNPELVKQNNYKPKEEQSSLRELYRKKENKPKLKPSKYQKHPFMDFQSHFPQELNEVDTLNKMSRKIEQIPDIVNRHKFKKNPVENMLEKIKRENENEDAIRQIEGEKVKAIGYISQKQKLKQLDKKNLPLSQQNIPFIMEKYGISRAEAYNLYNIYKSLQKISGARMVRKNDLQNVLEKGIDRETFDEGMKGLQINPGEEMIRNICYFPNFISWEQFIKIVSISLRKTPQSKLEAILEGMRGSGGHKSTQLSRQQIDIMVGSSISKIFGADEPQLRSHFLNIAMSTLDADNSGTIDIEELKNHVFKRSLEDMDLISYLLLNS